MRILRAIKSLRNSNLSGPKRSIWSVCWRIAEVLLLVLAALVVIVAVSKLGVGVIPEETRMAYLLTVLAVCAVGLIGAVAFIGARSLRVRPAKGRLLKKLNGEWDSISPSDPHGADKEMRIIGVKESLAQAAADGKRDYILAYEAFSSNYVIKDIDATIECLRAIGEIGHKPVMSVMTTDHLNIIATLSPHRREYADAVGWTLINAYAMSHPAAVPLMVPIVARGIDDLDTVMTMMREMQEMPSPALAEGML